MKDKITNISVTISTLRYMVNTQKHNICTAVTELTVIIYKIAKALHNICLNSQLHSQSAVIERNEKKIFWTRISIRYDNKKIGTLLISLRLRNVNNNFVCRLTCTQTWLKSFFCVCVEIRSPCDVNK